MANGNGTNGTAEQLEDFDAIIAESFGKIKVRGKVYTIRPVNALTQRHARELKKAIDAGEEMTAGEFAARLAPHCMDPEPSPEEAARIPTAVFERIMERASKGLVSMERVVAEGAEKKEDAPTAAPTPSP